jgi:hypothetical protein
VWRTAPTGPVATLPPPEAPAAVAVFIVAADLADSPLAAALANGDEPAVLDATDLRPERPLQGRLFEAISGASGSVRLLVAAVWFGEAPAPDLFSVADHVNLRLRGALTGRWPAGTPRAFPDLSAVYEREPAFRRPPSGARVYSGLTVAGVGDARSLTPFERRTVDRLSLQAASDSLVDAVILAAYRGSSVAAWCVPLAG